MIPPQILPPREGDPPIAPPQPSPEAQVSMAKVDLTNAKTENEKIRYQIELLKLLKETQETDTDVRNKIYQVLDELGPQQN